MSPRDTVFASRDYWRCAVRNGRPSIHSAARSVLPDRTLLNFRNWAETFCNQSALELS